MPIESALRNPVYIVKGRKQGTRRTPGFINGALNHRTNGATKVMVYHFSQDGELMIDLIPRRFIELTEFRLV